MTTEKKTRVWQEEGDTRIFSPDISSDELEWHVDFEDRVVEVLDPGGWSFQFDNKIPHPLFKGQIIYIKKFTWHRIIKGNKNLVVKVTKVL